MKKKNRFVTGIVTAGVLFSTALPFNVLAENLLTKLTLQTPSLYYQNFLKNNVRHYKR